MISLQAAAAVILYLIIGALIFGLLWWLIDKVGAVIGGEAGQPFIKIAKIILLILAVFVCIGILLSLVTGTPLFRP
jgi:hypothetical protein